MLPRNPLNAFIAFRVTFAEPTLARGARVALKQVVNGADWEDGDAIGINGDPTSDFALDVGAVYLY